MAHECDVVVLGLGPGGEHAAAELARAGLEVVAVDRRLVGGECPYYGCVPSKMMIREAARPSPSWADVASRIRDEATDDWDDTVAVERLQKAGATFVRGTGRLTGPGTVDVDGASYQARRGVVLNTGTEPSAPPVDGLEQVPYWTNRDAVRLTTLPASLVVIGGGAIGAELAQAFARFGVQVTLLEVADRLLAPEEPEASALVEKALATDGVQVRTGVSIHQVSYDEGRFTLALGAESLSADKLLVAAGRRNNIADIGLETVGLDPSARTLEPDERMRATEGIWAIGDITGKGAFTHMSMYQADVAVRDILDKDGPAADYRAVSRVTFTDPEVGSVGMSEASARDAGLDVRTGLVEGGSREWIAQEEGLVKLVAADGVLVGATAVGPAGGEVLGLLALAVHARTPVETLRTMHFAYPTYHRAIQSALADLG